MLVEVEPGEQHAVHIVGLGRRDLWKAAQNHQKRQHSSLLRENHKLNEVRHVAEVMRQEAPRLSAYAMLWGEAGWFGEGSRTTGGVTSPDLSL